ncbi:MAG: hypothetical protein EZS28_015797 [Streblomastix strix]|uniref:Uncharacterized protein n=1 Tax=Streblomastix strix TaxID=222440 RepID=A0A5J4W1Z2_9EUKA|nr:MAG: hypothetical protein EZS28_015797 [Streblomastix strix]
MERFFTVIRIIIVYSIIRSKEVLYGDRSKKMEKLKKDILKQMKNQKGDMRTIQEDLIDKILLQLKSKQLLERFPTLRLFLRDVGEKFFHDTLWLI